MRPPSFRICGLGILACLVSGCYSDAFRDEVITPASLRERMTAVSFPPAPATASPREEPASDGTLSLEEALAYALKHNHALIVAREDLEIASLAQAIAFTLFLPTPTLTYAYDRLDRLPAVVTPQDRGIPPITTGETNYRRIDGRLTMTLWDFGKTLGLYHQARVRRELSEVLYERLRQQLRYQVVSAYCGVLKAEAAFRSATEAFTQARAHLQVARSLRAHGVVDRNDVLRAAVQAGETKQLTIRTRHAVALATAGLNNVLGLPIHFPTRVQPVAAHGSELTLAQAVDFAADHRPELAMARKTIALEKEKLRTAGGDFWPRLYASGAYTYDDNDYTKFAHGPRRPRNDNWSAEVGATMDLLGSGLTVAQVERAQVNIFQAEEKAREMADNVAYQVREAWLAVTDARERIGVARASLAQARENQRLLMNKFRARMATTTDLLDAEALLVRNQENYYTVQYEWRVSLAQLENALGAPVGLALAREAVPGGILPPVSSDKGVQP